VLELFKVRYYAHVPLVLSNFFASRHLPAVTTVTDCAKDIEVIFKMYLVQFINPAKSLVAIHAVTSQNSDLLNDDDASGVRPGGRGRG